MKILNDAKIKKIISLAGFGLEMIFVMIFTFAGAKEGSMFGVFDDFLLETNQIVLHGIVLGVAVVSLVIGVIGILLELFKKKAAFLAATGFAANLVLLVLAIANKIYNVVFIVLALIVSLVLAAYLIYYTIRNREDEVVKPNADERKAIIPSIVFIVASLIAAFLIFVFPVCFYDGEAHFKLFDAMGADVGLECLISFTAFFVLFVALMIYASKIIIYSGNNPQKFYKKARFSMYASFVLTIVFYIFAIVIEFIDKKKMGDEVAASNIAFIPFLINGVIVILNSIFSAKSIKAEEKEMTSKQANRIIALIFALAFIALLVVSLFSNILVIKFESDFEVGQLKINGFNVLKDYRNVERGEYQAIAFLIYVILVSAVIMLTMTLAMFFRRSKFFYKSAFYSIIASFVLLVALSLFGKYYEIAERLNMGTLSKLLEYYSYNVSIDFTTKTSSDTMYFAIGGLVMLAALVGFRPFTKNIKDEALDVNIKGVDEFADAIGGSGAPGVGGVGQSDVSESRIRGFDACPAFSEIDREEEEINLDVAERRTKLFNNPSLPSLVRFIVEYAKESRLHLSYKEEDIAQFIAGLGSSKLSILQGMSGTGKTSLPKIFAEAILGNVNIIEVESSWKDKNELIGYFNEFSGKFTPKKFTQSLYRAKFAPDVITFIVLDEMNLSRIEYYFSDFLSLMENEEDKREIKLLNVQLKNIKNGQDLSYKMLNRGHTLKVPANVWFIGTANRDESTFEISDKVYDRAMTMNFTKRAPKIEAFNEPIDQRFLEYGVFKDLVNKALTTFKFDASSNPTIKEVEKLLEPYNISFGNRIEKQIEMFVSVYCSCFTEPTRVVSQAVEKILFSKVVAKLEFKSVENKEELAHSFEELGLFECAKFINKLNEDI